MVPRPPTHSSPLSSSLPFPPLTPPPQSASAFTGASSPLLPLLVHSVPLPSPRTPLGHMSKPVLSFMSPALPIQSLIAGFMHASVGSTIPGHHRFPPRRGHVGLTDAASSDCLAAPPQARGSTVQAIPTSVATGSRPSATGSNRHMLLWRGWHLRLYPPSQTSRQP
jgi:hypothetical protein